MVSTILYGYKSNGKHDKRFNAKDLNSSIYYVILRQNNYTAKEKVILLK